MIYYLPLEPYKERYTGQLHNWMQAGFDRSRLQPHVTVYGKEQGEKTIKNGRVLDAPSRVRWAFSQVEQLVDLIEREVLSAGDHVHLDDFWHPGLDALWYTLETFGLLHSVSVSAYCWAQSVDRFDFTHRMKTWMRPMEQAHAKNMRKVFVADEGLKELLDAAGVTRFGQCQVVGLPFDPEMVATSFTKALSPYHDHLSYTPESKAMRVVYSSRFDSEKNPDFFLDVAKRFRQKYADHPKVGSTEFVMLTAADEVRSNLDHLKRRIMQAETDGDVLVLRGLDKHQYYSMLRNSRVQFNCADQDWVSFTLLEAVTFGCWPVYPNHRSFPNALRHQRKFMYRPNDVEDAVSLLAAALSNDALYTQEAVKVRQNLILGPHAGAIDRIVDNADRNRTAGHLYPPGPDRDVEAFRKWLEQTFNG
jgi:glycosyltransferase involved in cell wall biosynthesis